jgi:hypothetical protein
MSGVNALSLSDEDFINAPIPEVEPAGEKVIPAGEAEDQGQVPVDPAAVGGEELPAAGQEPVADPEIPADDGGDPAPEAAADDGNAVPGEGEGAEGAEAKPDSEEEKPQDPVENLDYEAAYKQIMAPFKANGKEITLRSPDEAIKLMQLGANYGRKMQELAPHRKVLLMLQNNDLLDETKLSYLIDLDKKNPAAIQQLIKDAGIDPLDIDTSKDPAYQPGAHRVSDQEANFHNAVNEIVSFDGGRETLQIIDAWDNTSKDALWENPELMTVIHDQRSQGIYDLIVAEVERKRLIGEISPNTPFLQAYHAVGNQMVAEQQGVRPQGNVPAQGQPQVVATRTVVPKSSVTNGDKARAASSPRSTPATAKATVNPLSLSDDEFLKQMGNRL